MRISMTTVYVKNNQIREHKRPLKKHLKKRQQRERKQIRPTLINGTKNCHWERKTLTSCAKTQFLLMSVTKSCLIGGKVRASSIGYNVRQTYLTSILPAILLYCWNEDKIDNRGSDLGHDDLSIAMPRQSVTKQSTAILPRIDRSDVRNLSLDLLTLS